jgi:hypothetical protein
MNHEKTFRTKTGFCHVLPDSIVLTRHGIISDVAAITVGNGMINILLIYGGLAISLFYFAFENYTKHQLGLSVLFGIGGIYLVYGLINSLNNSATPSIDRKKIKGVTFKKGLWGLTRSRFEVLFEDEKGRIKKRLIMLPGVLKNGDDETVKAMKIMKDEKLI